MGTVEDPRPALQHHLLQHDPPVFRLHHRQMGAHDGMALGIQPVQPLPAESVDAAGNAGDIAVGHQAAQGLPVFQQENTLARSGGRDGRRRAGHAAAADRHVRKETLAR